MPEVASVPVTVTPTAWLYQPFVSGPRAAAIADTAGGVASRLIVTSSRQHCEPLTVTVHVSVCAVVSDEMVTFPQPCGLLEPAGRTNDTVTSARYQPLLQGAVAPDELQLAVMTSARAAAGGTSRRAGATTIASARLIAPPPELRRPREDR